MILNEDAIAQTICEYERTAVEGFRQAQQRHIDTLRREWATERTARLTADRIMTEQARLIGEQRAELDRYTGRNVDPSRDCGIYRWTVGGAVVLVEYEHHPSDELSAESIGGMSLLISGGWIDAADMLHEDKIEDLRVDILDSLARERERDLADAAIAAQEARA